MKKFPLRKDNLLLFSPEKFPALHYRTVPGNPGAEKRNERLVIVLRQLLVPEFQPDMK